MTEKNMHRDWFLPSLGVGTCLPAVEPQDTHSLPVACCAAYTPTLLGPHPWYPHRWPKHTPSQTPPLSALPSFFFASTTLNLSSLFLIFISMPHIFRILPKGKTQMSVLKWLNCLYLKYAVSRLQASIFDSGSTWQNVFDKNGTGTVDWRISGYYSKTKTFWT